MLPFLQFYTEQPFEAHADHTTRTP